MEAASVPATPVRRARSRARSDPRARRAGGCGSAVFAIVLFCLFPFYWLLNTSLKTGAGPVERRRSSRRNPTLDNYESIFKDSNFTNALRNSAIVALVTTALALIVGSFAPTRSRG